MLYVKKYGNKTKQNAFLNAIDCLYYGYGQNVWNAYDLDEETRAEIWEQATKHLANL